MPRLDISDGVPTLDPSLFALESWGDTPSALDIAFGPAPSGASFACPCCGGARHKLDNAAPVRPELSDLPASAIIQNQSGPGGDAIPPNATTPFTLAIGGSQTGFVNLPGDDDWFRVELVAGQTYVFTLTGNGATPLPDPYLELYNANSALIAIDDDAGPAFDSMLRFTATQSGTYYINARAWEPDTGPDPDIVGGYQLAVNFGLPQNPLDTIDLGFSAPFHIDVYFALADESFGPSTAIRSWTQSEINSAMAALQTFANVTNLTFSQVFSQAQAEFTLFIADLPENVLGQFITTGIGGPTQEGYGEFADVLDYWTPASLQPGGVGWVTLIHEFGHGLGLAHPHDNGGNSEIMQGVIDPFDSFGTFLLNQGVFTTMGYNDGWTSVFDQPPPFNYGMQATPMALDLGLLQQRYGADPSTNLGDTLYTLPTSNAPGTFFSCIWDAGGIDTIQAGGSGNCTIDLHAATLLNEIGGGGFVSSHTGTEGGFTIASGALIENARGGLGNDMLTGNSAANVLEGQGGNDNLSGAGGDDALVGGAGNDTMDGGAGLDRAWYADAPSAVTVSLALAGVAQNTSGAGLDTLTSIEVVFGSSFNDILTGSSSNDTLIGRAGNDLLTGAAGADWLVGEAGDDTFVQGVEVAGIDNLFGGAPGADAGFDTIDYSAAAAGVIVQLSGYATTLGASLLAVFSGIEAAIGTAFNDALIGSAANNRITGGAGIDWLVGGAGDDWFVQGVDGAVDNLFGDSGADTIDYGAAASGVIVQLSGYSTINGGALLSTFSGFENAIGTNLNDALIGNASNNRLAGGAGSDWLVGGDGDDTFVQGVQSGVDNIFGGVSGSDSGFDTIDYSTASAAVIVQLSGYSTQNGGGNPLLATFTGIETTVGSSFNDALIGNASDNRLTGGIGADWLVGGAGADDFVYQGIGEGGDTINGFSRTDLDQIDLSAIDAVTATGGDDSFVFSTTRTNGLAGEVVAATFASSTTLSVYLDSDNVADMVIQIIHQSGLVMNAGDFLL